MITSNVVGLDGKLTLTQSEAFLYLNVDGTFSITLDATDPLTPVMNDPAAITMTVYLAEYPSVTLSFNVGVIITPCVPSTLLYSNMVDQVYYLNQADMTVNFPVITADPNCWTTKDIEIISVTGAYIDTDPA